MLPLRNRNLIALSFSQFGMAITVHYINVFMPFYVLDISPYSYRQTMIWLGLIMGLSGLLIAFTSNLWGLLTSRFSPKLLYLRGTIIYTVLYVLMGFTSNLPLLLLLRSIQGLFGGISTIGLIIIASSSSRERIGADIGFFQGLQTMGQLAGPAIGAYAASALGYRGAFIGASAIVSIVALFCHFGVTDVPKTPKQEKWFDRTVISRDALLGWILCLMITVQLRFLTTILPKVLEEFQIQDTLALKWAGIIVLLYSGSASLGILFWSRLTLTFNRAKLILFLVITGTVCQAALSLTGGLASFIAIRMVQTSLIAAAISLIISIFVTEVKGEIIGFLNSAKFAGAFLGPIIATSTLAFSNLTVLYCMISSLTFIAFFGFRRVLVNDMRHKV